MIDVAEYLNKKHYNYKIVTRRSGMNYVMNCPFCDDTENKFAINAKTGAYKCLHENKCGAKGSWWDFQRKLGDKPEHLNHPTFTAVNKPSYVRPKPKAHKLGDQLTNWLIKRNITEDAIKHFKLGEHNPTTVMYPYFKDGELVNVKYRDITNKKFWNSKNSEPVLFNRDNIQGDVLNICEGEMDTLAMYIYGIESVSVSNGTGDMRWLENEYEWLQRFSRINIIMDMDLAGEKAVAEIVNRLGKYRCYRVNLPYKDPNECLVKGVSAEDIQACIDNAQEFEIDILKRVDTFIDGIKKFIHNPELLKGIGTPFRGLDRMLQGFRQEELTVLSGNNGSGKSTLLNQIMLTLARKGQRSCMTSLEMPAERYLYWAVQQESFNGEVNDANIDMVLGKLRDHVFIVDTAEEITPEKLFDTWEFAARKYGVKFFFLDSLMRIDFNGQEEYDAQKEFVSKLLSFSKKYKSHIFLVAHPRKGESDAKTPGKVDIAGTANITNLAHNVLMLWRTTEEARKKAEEKGKNIADALLYLKKNRTHGTEGMILLEFDIKTRTYTEVQK